MADTTVALRHEKRNTEARQVRFYTVKDGETIPQGAYVTYVTSGGDAGLAVNGGDDANSVFVGIATQTVEGDGEKQIAVESGFDLLATTAASGAVAGNVGALLYLVDNQTLDDIAGTTNDVPVGTLIQRVTDTSGWVRLESGARVDVDT
jgi:hypothetical protein